MLLEREGACTGTPECCIVLYCSLGAQGFFTVYSDLFDRLAREEERAQQGRADEGNDEDETANSSGKALPR
jgi:hypothetical protein